MTTLADLTSAIADDIDDTTNEYSAQILTAVQAAQRYCERTTYYFNETRDVTFSTVNGQEWYGAADNANIPTLIRIEAVYSEDTNAQRVTLDRDTRANWNCWPITPARPASVPVDLLQPEDPALSHSRRHSLHDPLQLGLYRLAPLVNPTDTNAWLSEAYDMLKARAKYILCKDTLKDPSLAAEALNDWRDQDEALAG
jgi:hypothetical protein